MPGRIGRVLRDPDRTEIDVGVEQALLLGRKFFGADEDDFQRAEVVRLAAA